MESNWKPKKRFPVFLTFFFLVLFLILVAAGAVFFWYQSNISPTQVGTEKVFVVRPGESTKEVASDLQSKGLIRNALAFQIFLKINQKNPKIEAGSFNIKPGQSLDEVLRSLSVGKAIDKWVTIKEGLRDEEVAAVLSKEFPFQAADFIKLSKEGFMFPDTYLIPVDADAATAAQILSSNFDKRVTKDLRDKFSAKGLSLDQAVNLASIVEREGRSDSDRAVIAGILLRRLGDKFPLQVDATIQFALGFQDSGQTWWKQDITTEDLKIDSPYNTYKNPGLPPGPICNPGLSSLNAVANAEKTDYYYYLYDKNGGFHPAKTLDEHNANVAKYLQ